MGWLIQFLTSSLGKKVVMGLTGLFLILFLPVHLGGNLQLLNNDEGATFNEYAEMMAHNPFIKITSFGLYAFIIIHAIQGLLIWAANRKATGVKYAVNSNKNVTWASKNMALLGSLLLIFIGIHMGDFWYAMKFQGESNLYEKVVTSFSQLWIVIVYVISMIALGFHLVHGFGSAFQTLGLNHKKYTPIIDTLGKIYAVVISALYAIIPILMYLGIDLGFSFKFL